ncbi:MAG: L-fuculose-phosphate aldolase, partial [Pseudonocardia sp.]
TYLEWLCRLHHQASLLGTPSLIPPDELERVTAKLRTYGQRPPESGK